MLRSIVDGDEGTYVLVGEWPDITTLADACVRMIETLNTFRHRLEDLGPGLGVTDAISGKGALTLKCRGPTDRATTRHARRYGVP